MTVYARIQIYVIVGVLVAAGLMFWPSAEPPKSSVESAKWLKLSQVQRTKISQLRRQVYEVSSQRDSAIGHFRTRVRTLLDTTVVHDTVLSEIVTQLAQSAEVVFRNDSILSVKVDSLHRADSTALFSADSVIRERDKRIVALERTTWRDYVTVAVGVDAYGKPNLLVGVKIWPRMRRARP